MSINGGAMKTFTVLKEVVKVYVVTVEAEDATLAIIKAYNGAPDEGELLRDYAHNPAEWAVYDAEDDSEELQELPCDKQAIETYVYPQQEEAQ